MPCFAGSTTRCARTKACSISRAALSATQAAGFSPKPSAQGIWRRSPRSWRRSGRQTCATTCGDGRLSQGEDGYHASEYTKGPPLPGVDATGWRSEGAAAFQGCWCCSDGVCSSVCPPTSGACAGKIMPPAQGRVVKGYVIHIAHLHFDAGVVPAADRAAGVKLDGCVSFGQWRHYRVPTSGIGDSHVLLSISSPVEGVYAALDGPPSLSEYDVVARGTDLNLTLTACDLATSASWHVAVHLGAESEGIAESLFVLRFRSASGTATLGEEIRAHTCCGAFTYWRVLDIPHDAALSVHVAIETGALHGVFVQHDSCPIYDLNDPYAQCSGRCEVHWLTRWGRITGARHSRDQGNVTVPMGLSTQVSDERRAGAWFVGIKALPEESGVYTFRLSLQRPPPVPERPYCSGQQRFCVSATQREVVGGLPLITAAEDRKPPLSQSGAASSREAPARHALAIATAVSVGVMLHISSSLRRRTF